MPTRTSTKSAIAIKLRQAELNADDPIELKKGGSTGRNGKYTTRTKLISTSGGPLPSMPTTKRPPEIKGKGPGDKDFFPLAFRRSLRREDFWDYDI